MQIFPGKASRLDSITAVKSQSSSHPPTCTNIISTISTNYFKYRYDAKPHKLPHDRSLVTYSGHRVLNTLIRCHFSPEASTGSRYVYSGSANGKVPIYNLDATRAGIVDVQQAAMHNKRRETGIQLRYGGWSSRINVCVRDVSWHPHAPILAGKFPSILSARGNGWWMLTALIATSWSDEYGRGMVSVHTWNGDKAAKDSDEFQMEDVNGASETRNYTTKMQEFHLRTNEEEEEEIEARYSLRNDF